MKRIQTLLTLLLIAFLNIGYSQSAKELNFNQIPVRFFGQVIDAYELKDSDGQHIYLVTKITGERTEIRGAKFSKVDTGYLKIWEIKDFGEEIAFHFPYTTIVDIDNDGRLETMFVYQINPGYAEGSNWKIILHHKNKKYVLKAHVPELDHDKYSVSIDQAPSNIRKGLNNLWSKIVREKDLKTQ